MKPIWTLAVLTALGLSIQADEPAKPAEPAPANLQELQKLITLLRAHYAAREALGDQSLTEAARDGVLRKLGVSAQILSAADAAQAAEPGAAVAKQRAFTPSIAYVRVGTLQSGAAKAVEEALTKAAEQKPQGIVLDLRFADGRDFGEAAAVAGLFLAKGKPLLSLQAPDGATAQKFENARDPLFPSAPLILLMNGGTRGAPEALAALLQKSRRALLIGSASGTEGFVQTDFPLGDGSVLRLATAKVIVAGSGELWPRAVEPDIAVKIPPNEERATVFETAPKKEKKTSAASAFQPHSEAELISIYDINGDASHPKPSPELQEQTDDPVLQRALDVLSAWRTFQPAAASPADESR